MTFTLPEALATQLLRRVPARHRSQYVCEALGAKLRERADRLLLACELANADPDILAIEREWEALPDQIKKPWNDGAAR